MDDWQRFQGSSRRYTCSYSMTYRAYHSFHVALSIYIISMSDTSAFLLEAAIPAAASDPRPLVDAVYWLESSLLLELGHFSGANMSYIPTPVLKNLGLAHVHLSQCKLLSSDKPLMPPSTDHFKTVNLMKWPAKKYVQSY